MPSTKNVVCIYLYVHTEERCQHRQQATLHVRVFALCINAFVVWCIRVAVMVVMANESIWMDLLIPLIDIVMVPMSSLCRRRHRPRPRHHHHIHHGREVTRCCFRYVMYVVVVVAFVGAAMPYIFLCYTSSSLM